jgi:EAL domain-containing protein (putative c-di-GMP-specific phosphodiesterase class I)
VKNARAALTRAKEQGRNNYQMYTTAMTSIINERVIMENSLKKAIQKQEFILHYQPIVTAEGEKITGVEALLRWQHPSLGLIIPGKFISVAEETGLIVDIGKWVLTTACRQNKCWQDAGMPKIPVTVNISPLQFYQEDLVDTIKVVLKETGLEACYLELDISETALKNQETAVKILEKLKNTGTRISIDDFGSGTIPLKSLKKLPVDSLKIDKAFINDLVCKGNEEIAASIISLGHSFDYNITAVGVETKEHFMILKNHNCDRIQGYYFSEPVHEERFAWLMGEQGGNMN